MTIKAVLFDLDGTLVDSNDYHVAAWYEVFRDEGFTVSKDTIYAQIGKGADMLVPALLPGADDLKSERLGKAQGEIYKFRFRDCVRPFPSARDLLVRTRDAGKQVVLATSASRADLDIYIELLDARDLVVEVTCADDVEHTKPAADVFAAALKKLPAISAEEAIVIGDTPYDIGAARRCGIGAIGLRSGKFSAEGLRQAGAVALYEDVAALLADFVQSPIAG